VQVARVPELVDQARLAHAGRADDGRDLTMAGAGVLQRAAQMLQLVVASDEADEPARGGGLEAGARRPHARHLVDLHGLGEPLDRNGAEGSHREEALHEVGGRGREEDAPGAGELLHPRGQVGRLADRGVVHAQIAADGAHHDFARVEPDPDLHVHAVRSARLLRVARHRFLHAQSGVAGAHRVVLVGERCTEEGHDAVAHHLVHRALVAVHRFHHPVEHGVEDPAGVFRVAVGEQFHRALHVGEQHRHLLAFAFQRTLRCEDFIGQVLGSVGLRGAERGLSGDADG
jgi:hypothetical protein